MNSLVDMDNPIQKWTIGFVVRSLVTVGLNRFIDSWNNHRISGPSRGIPIQRALDNNVLSPLRQIQIPSTEELLADYRANSGRINENMSDLYPFDERDVNVALMAALSNTFTIETYNNHYNLMLSGDSHAIIELIREHQNIVLSFITI